MNKRPFLVLYDYGQGGVWAFVMARSDEEITSKYPELRIVRQAPRWMSEQEQRRIRERLTFDIDDPHGLRQWLAGIATPRHSKRAFGS